MNILILQSWLTRGGSEIVSVQIAYTLQKRGHAVSLVVLDADTSNMPSFTKNVRVCTIPIVGRIVRKNKLLFYFFSFFLLLPLALQKAIRADTIIAFNAPSLWIAAILSIVLRKRILWWCNDLPRRLSLQTITSGKKEYVVWRIMQDVFDRWALPFVATVLVFSEKTARQIQKVYKRAARVVHCGPDEEFLKTSFVNVPLRANRKSFTMLLVGKLHPQKNQLVAIKALKFILPAIPDAKLLLVGNGPMQKALSDAVVHLNIKDHVVFTGFLSQAKLLRLYTQCDLVLFPAKDQSWGLTPLEALLMGKTSIVSSETGVAPFLATHKIGIIKKPTAEDFAAGILTVYRQKKAAHAMAKRGEKIVREKLSWDTVADALEKVLVFCVMLAV